MKKAQPVKNFDWKDLLRHHSVFSSLEEEEIERLLEDEVSRERDYSQGSVILREGELGDSIFLIGSGSVQVVLPGEEGREITLSILKKGEFFGEMAVFERRPRAATVMAKENCMLLEVKGQEFFPLMTKHSDIAFKVLSERLRHANEQVVAVKMKNVDEKLNLFDTKLDAQLKAIDVELKAAHTVFDQTKTRTDEVIFSAERSRTRLTVTASAIGTVISVVIAFFGWLGFSEVQDIRKNAAEIRKERNEISDVARQVERDADLSRKAVEDMKKQSEELGRLNQLLFETREEIAEKVLLPGLLRALKERSQSDAIAFYEELRKLKPDDPNLTLRLLAEIEAEIVEQKEQNRGDYTELLQMILTDARTPKEKITSYYLLLTNAILVNWETFDVTLSAFEKYVGEYNGERIKEGALSTLDNFFAKQSREEQESFQRVKRLIPMH